MKVSLVLERGSPARLNPIIAEACARLQERGVDVAVRFPEEELLRVDTLAVDADLYVLKSSTSLALSLATMLDRLGGRLLNRLRASIAARDKLLAAATLARAGIPAPRSLVAGQPVQLAGELAAGPLIVKPYRGAYGRGVAVADAPTSLPAAAAHPELVFAQEFLTNARTDLKVFAIGDELFAVRKAFAEDSFLHAGQPAHLSPDVEAIVHRVGQAFGLELYGVDLAEDEDGVQVFDVNFFPGYRGVPDAARRLADYIAGALQRG